MHLTLIGSPKGKSVWVGVVKKPKEHLETMAKVSPDELSILASHDMPAGWDTLALMLVRRDLSSFQRANDWFGIHPSQALAAVTRAVRATQISKPRSYKFSAAMKYIRTAVFSTSQEVIGAITGNNASSISRWESGALEPSLADIKRLRDFAYANGLPWDDAAIWGKESSDAGETYSEAPIGVAS